MVMDEYSVNFSETFKAERMYIAKILRIAADDKGHGLTKDDISSMTGIPTGESSGKVVPHLKYASFMGLVNYQLNNKVYDISIPTLGNKIYKEDPCLYDEISLLLCQCMMTRVAPMWKESFRGIISKYHNDIDKEQLTRELKCTYKESITSKNLTPFIGTYKDGMFAPLNLFEYDKNTIKFSGCHINEEYIYLYAYILWRIWDDKFKYSQCDELTAIEIAELNYGDIFGWTSINEYNVLDIMASKELIRMNRQLEPYTVRRLVSEDFLLNRMYCDLL